MDNIQKFHLLRQAVKCGCPTCKSTMRNISVAQAVVRKGQQPDLSFGNKIAAEFALQNIEGYYSTLEKNLALHESKPIKSGVYTSIKDGKLVK